MAADTTAEVADDGDTKTALFRQLNQGANVVSGLKKVSKESKQQQQQQQHKPSEPLEPKSKVVKEEKEKTTSKPPATTTTAAKTPSITKRGPRYMCEYFTEGIQQLTQAGIMDEVFIFKCQNSAYIIPGKVKVVTIDSCSKIQVEINDVVSTIEMVNSQSVTLYIKGSAPSITVDNCSEPRLLIFQEALEKEPHIITSMVTGMNVEVPGDNEDDTWKEISIPQQFETIVDPVTKKAVTKPVLHA